MTQALTVPSLPPPTIFTHDETLHRISLPPLANFLTDLSAPEQLIKLKDILDRYRTPKSYHRIDVREVDSSEVPHEDAVEERERLIYEKKERERTGRRPVVLPPEVMVDAYLAQKAAELAQTRTNGHEKAENGRSEGESAGSEIPLPIPQPMDITHPSPSTPAPIKSYTLPTDTAPLPSGSLSPPPAPRIHPIPPSGPKRRIRELRLDLRTLDAAALFALENWRRDVLGLDRLEMEVPDSIWYKEPTPELGPEPKKVRKKIGRPRKVRASTAAEERVEVQVHDEDGDVGETVLGQETIAPQEKEVLEMSGKGDPQAASDNNDQASIANAVPLATDHIHTNESGPGMIRRNSKSPTKPPRTPSPDMILHDAYDEKDDADPDFVPPPTPPPKRETRKKRQSAMAAPPATSALQSVDRPLAQNTNVESVEAGPSSVPMVKTESTGRKRGRSSLIPTPPKRIIALSPSAPLKTAVLDPEIGLDTSSPHDRSACSNSTSIAVEEEPVSEIIAENPALTISSPRVIPLSSTRKRPRKSLVEVCIPQYKPKPRRSLPNPPPKTSDNPRASTAGTEQGRARAPRRSMRGKAGSVEIVEALSSIPNKRRGTGSKAVSARTRRSGNKGKNEVIVIDDDSVEEEGDPADEGLQQGVEGDVDMGVESQADGAEKEEEEEEAIPDSSQTSEGEWGFLKGIST